MSDFVDREVRKRDTQRRRQMERRRSHINDPAPKKWTLVNMWVFGKHLPLDWGVVICTVILTLIGSLMVLSASSYTMGVTGSGNAMSEFMTQVQGMVLGGAGFLLMASLDYRWLNQRWIVMALCGASFVMLFLVKGLPTLAKVAPFVNSGALFIRSPYLNDAYRWLHIGPPGKTLLSIQPSEILKVAIVIYLAYYMNLKQGSMHLFWRNNFGCLMVVGVMVLLLLWQPNLSTACLIAFVTLFMLVAGGMRLSTLSLLLVMALAAFYVLARYLIDDRWIRITSFLNPWDESVSQGSGYQLIQSYYALGNGGWFGTGLGLSKQKHLFLPYAYSDFIFAVVGEELGFFGCVGILSVFLSLIFFGLRIAINAVDRFGTYLALGTTSLIALQVIINVLVVTGFAPTTGIPLPFFTSGGTTMAIFLSTMGLLVSVSRRPAAIKERLAPPALRRLRERLRGAEA